MRKEIFDWIADRILDLGCWLAQRRKNRRKKAERWARLDAEKVRRGVLGLLR
jgi:hypothetical protein